MKQEQIDVFTYLKKYSTNLKRKFTEVKTLYHYTSQSSLKGIVEKIAIWLSHIQWQNDKMELVYGKQFITMLVNEKYQPEANNAQRNYWERVIKDVDAFFSKCNIFTFSLSADPDSLSQWRGYTNLREGGNAIGFGFVDFQNLLNKKGYLILPVVYDKEEQREYIEEYLNGFIDIQIKFQEQKIESNDFLNLWASFINFLSILLITFKSDSFQEEREWRVVFGDSFFVDGKFIHKLEKLFLPKPQFRVKGKYFIPYIELSFAEEKTSIIKEIYLSPDVDNRERKRNYEYFLSMHKMLDVEIIESKIQYRIG